MKKDYNRMKKLTSILTEHPIRCTCGHTMVMHPKLNKQICDWCQRYVFRTPKDEFEYRFLEQKRKKEKE